MFVPRFDLNSLLGFGKGLEEEMVTMESPMRTKTRRFIAS